MNNYYLHSIILDNCPFSSAANDLLNNYFKNKLSNFKFTFVNNQNKENYKTNDINTFPQIYLKRKNKNGSLLLGGYDDLKEFFDTFYKTKYNDKSINQFINKKKWSKKSTLRLIQLINS